MGNPIISSADLFKGLDGAELDLLEKRAKEMVLPVDKIIFKEGEPGDKMFLLVHGVVEIWKSEDKELKGSRLARLKQGEIFGEMSLFDKEPRSATAVTAMAKETRVLIWDEKEVSELLQQNPRLGTKILNNILKKVSHRLRVANDAIHTLMRSHQYISL